MNRAAQKKRCSSERRDSHLSERVFQLLYSDHVCSFGEEFWAHQLYKILKINMTSHLRKRDFVTEFETTHTGRSYKHEIQKGESARSLQFMFICWLSSISSISVGMYPIVLIQFPRSLQLMKPSLSLSNSLKASRNSVGPQKQKL